MFNLSALHRENLFPSAQQPAVAVVFENVPATERDSFLYVTVERDLTYREHGVLRVGPENIHRVSVNLAATDRNTLKVAAWGTARDMALVKRLREVYPSLTQYLAAKDLEMSTGYKDGKRRMPDEHKDGKRKRPVPVEFRGLPWLTGGKLPPFHLNASSLPLFQEEWLEHARSRDIYRGPLLLAGSGLNGNRVVASICANDVIYSRSFYGTPMGKVDLRLAYFLNGVLNSSLATYFVFLTATNWGVEKYEILLDDYLGIPVPDMAKADQQAVGRLLKVEEKLRQRGSKPSNQRSVAELDDAVFDLYQLESWERVLVEDMLALTIDHQRKHGKSQALGTPDTSDCQRYAESLI